MKLKRLLILGILCLTFGAANAQSAADKILGTYYISDDQSDEDCKVKIVKTSSGTYEGRIFWIKHPTNKDGSQKKDVKNPDPNKRNTPSNQVKMLYHFRYDAKENKWVDGEIYDPVHGKYYKSKMWFEKDGLLHVRGYIGTPALGRTMTWKKLD